MPRYSLIVQVDNPDPSLFQGMLESLQNQTDPDWEAVLLHSGHFVPPAHPQVRAVDTTLPLPQVLNALTDSLGTYFGMLGQHDRLEPDTLAQVWDGDLHYTNEHSFFENGQVNWRLKKGPPDRFRARQQNYFMDLLMVRKAWFLELGGLDTECSTDPWHDLILRTFAAKGVIFYDPEERYQRFRPYRLGAVVPSADLRAVQKALPGAMVDEFARNIRIQYQVEVPRSVTLVVFLSGNLVDAMGRIRAIKASPPYAGMDVQAVLEPMDPGTQQILETMLDGSGWQWQVQDGSRAQTVNRIVSRLRTQYMMLMDSTPLDPRWLQVLMAHAQQEPNLWVTGAVIQKTRLTLPGVSDWLYEGVDWNSRGHMNQLQVSHLVPALGDACTVIPLRGFDGFPETEAYVVERSRKESCLYVPEVRFYTADKQA